MPALMVLVLIGALTWGVYHYTRPNPYGPPQEELIAPPGEFTTAFWDEALGGDTELTPERWAELSDSSKSDLGLEDAGAAATLGRNVTTADLTGDGRSEWPQYWPEGGASVACTEVQILGASAMKMPVSNRSLYAKILVGWTGTCADTEELPNGVANISYVYAHKNDSEWVPVREWQVPVSGEMTAASFNAPEEFELKELGECGDPENSEVKARIIVSNAWDLMCADAQKDGVSLKASAGYRTLAEQSALFKSAVKYYGSVQEAKRWVAYADEFSCSSKHCDGTALSVKDGDSLVWLNQEVGCSVDGKVTMGVGDCKGGQSIKRMNLYGFASTVPYVPTYLEFILPVETTKVAPNCNPAGSNTAVLVAAIFRCRLQAAGLSEEEVDQHVAEALVVSRCESGWNPLALAFGGQFATKPHPVSGKTYTHAGVFMLSAEEADELLPQGRTALADPVQNINAAASLWLVKRDWSSWGCATGRGELFEAGPVLPQFGGPELPQWARSY